LETGSELCNFAAPKRDDGETLRCYQKDRMDFEPHPVLPKRESGSRCLVITQAIGA